MNPYDAEAYAFSCSRNEQPDAFRVAADAFEQVGLLEAAEHRRSWAEQIEGCHSIVEIFFKTRLFFNQINPIAPEMNEAIKIMNLALLIME